ncbi:glycosyltransferase [Glycomyces sp. L485]|uniref:glycosyltransferase n=1 Tax=Glycomyces sp. L485 TaxID=2909235 RepID=UPI001F4B1A3E|nr:glycosyltransferase [Glycomyces sp. L485]MCH7230795.1 glycosyltransferase [Glycomyces sp. L485]
MSSPYLSVVVPVRDNAQGLELTLRSLAAQDLPADEWEVIVVDDGSAVPAAGTAPLGPGNLRVERLYPGGSRAKARNLGIAVARGEVVLLLDGDSYAVPDLVRRHAAFHRGSETAQVLLGNRFEPSWDTVRRLHVGDTKAPTAGVEQDIRQSWFGMEASALATSRVPWAFMFTHNTSVRTRDLEAVGGFDEDFAGWGHEDVDLGYRLFAAAGRPDGQFVLDPDAYCFHVPHFRDFGRQGVEEERNTALLRRKHPRFDIELFGGSRTHLAAKVAYYETVLETFRSSRVDVAKTLEAVVEPAADMLVIGGVAAPERAGRTVTWNHRAPASEDNPHLLGVRTPFKDGELDDVVHVDLWQHLLPDDVSALVAESLRIARRLRLVSTAPNPNESACDPDYLVRMLADRFRVDQSALPDARVSTIERRAPESPVRV